MIWAVNVTFISFILFVIFGLVFSYEQKVGKRVFLDLVRTGLDNVLLKLGAKTQRFFVYLGRYIITLSWYYSLHTFLKFFLKALAKLYFSVETLLQRNRVRAKKIRSERRQSTNGDTHLSQIANHKAETALTEAEKNKRKKLALEGK